MDANADMSSGIPLSVLARFTAAESAIYPLAMTDPERYERAVTAVGLVAQHLRDDCASVAELVARLPAAADDVVQVASAEGVSLAGLDPTTIGNAAAALRYRELHSGASPT